MPAAMSSETILPRPWKWIVFVLLFAVLALSPMALFGIITVIAVILHPSEAMSNPFILLGPLGLCGWIFIGWKMVTIFRSREQPIAILDENGLSMPLLKPSHLKWTDIRAVEQVVYKKTYLRLQLQEPRKHLSKWQTLSNTPFSDSALLVLDYSGSPVQHPSYLLAKTFFDQAISCSAD